MSVQRTCDCCNQPMGSPAFSLDSPIISPSGKYLGSVRVSLKTASSKEDICTSCILAALTTSPPARPVPNHTPAARVACEADG